MGRSRTDRRKRLQDAPLTDARSELNGRGPLDDFRPVIGFAGHSALVTLKLRQGFAAKLLATRKFVVRESETAKDRSKTSYRSLQVVR